MTQPITLRAHQVLCLMGFRGEGYSVTFIAEMSHLLRELQDSPEQQVRLTTAPDRLCRACIHLRRGGCTLGGPDHETHMRQQDEAVLGRLGLDRDGVYPWSLIQQRIAASVQGADLAVICTTCPWLELGWCAEGVDRLRSDASPRASSEPMNGG